MSVINQMLKDLDDRQSEQQGASATHMPQMPKNSSHKNLIIVVVILVLLNVIGFLAWKLYGNDENLAEPIQPLEQQTAITQNAIIPKAQQSLIQTDNTLNTANTVEASLPAALASNPKDSLEAPEALSAHYHSSDKVSSHTHPEQTPTATTFTETPAQTSQIKPAEAQVKESAMKIKTTTVDKATEKSSSSGSFSISRKHLTSKELIAQKIAHAESAIEKNQISKAESLLEEVLLLDAKQVDTRKKLAALWFGREAFQDAVSLINQGINLDPNDAELRLMKARIYLQNDRPDRAYTSLKGFTETDDIEYLSLLATLAEQLNELPMAINTYQRLTKIQPDMGKWWLGYAIAQDRNSDFKGALQAYKNAIEQNDMSRGSTAFAKKRMSELGE